MKIKKLMLIVVLTQLSVACLATPYEPTKSPPNRKGVAPPKSSPTDQVQTPTCRFQFGSKQSLEEIAITAAEMQQDCGLTAEQVLALAHSEFSTK